MIYLLHKKATIEQLTDMMKEYENMLKIVVDIRRRVLAGGVRRTLIASPLY